MRTNKKTTHTITLKLGKFGTRCAGANKYHLECSAFAARYIFWNGDMLVIYPDGSGSLFSGKNQVQRDDLKRSDILIETDAEFNKRVQPEVDRMNEELLTERDHNKNLY